jgi:Protein of unknown function (DUF620)
MTRRILLLAALGAFTALAADEALPKAETILDHYVEVTGGKAAYMKRKSETATGTMELTAQGIKGTLVRYQADPDKSYTLLDIAGVGKIEAGSANGVAWEMTAIMGPRVKSGDEKAQALRESAFNGLLNWRKLYPKVETIGTEVVDGEECYMVLLTPAEGKPETNYYQKKSGLIVKMTTVASTQMGEIPLEVRMSDYKDFGGVLSASKVTQKAAGQEYTITLQTVKVNEEIPDSRFDPPAEVKALIDKAAAAKK